MAIGEGSTVKLKSGGELMTVTGLVSDSSGKPMAHTVWHDKKGEEKQGYYPVFALREDDGGPVIA